MLKEETVSYRETISFAENKNLPEQKKLLRINLSFAVLSKASSEVGREPCEGRKTFELKKKQLAAEKKKKSSL